MRPSEKEKRIVRYDNVLREWVFNLISHKYISNYLRDKGLVRVAIYGFSELGEMLYEELIENGVRVEYIADKNYSILSSSSIKVISPDDMFQMTEDVVVVTAIVDYPILREIYNMKKLVSLEQIIYELGVEK